MPESLRSRMLRFAFNWFPAYRGSGGRVTYIAGDFREVRVRVPLNWRTRNYVGSIFGGSMFGAVDPMYMIMLIRALGSGYEVWDKSAEIRFRKPGRTALHAVFALTDDELREIREVLRTSSRTDRTYSIELRDDGGVVHATIAKTIHIRLKAATA